MARFDAVADRYDAFCATPLGGFVDEVERQVIVELLAPRSGETLVDLGCGTGSYTVFLASLGCSVVGIDLSAAMLEKARQKPVTGGKVDYVQADLARLLYPSATFDGGLLQVTLEFVDEPAAVINEALRVLKTNGRLVVGLIHGPWAQHYRIRAQKDPSSIYGGARFWTLPDLERLVGAVPSLVRGALYVRPDEFRSVSQAWRLERERRRTAPLEDAGFLAVRWGQAGAA